MLMTKYFYAILISLLLLAVGCSRGRTDEQVAADVQNKINADASFPDKGLQVSASHGVVTLSGRVSSEVARSAAATDAAQVEGVKTVVNNLVVTASASADTAPTQTLVPNNLPPLRAKPSPRLSAGAATSPTTAPETVSSHNTAAATAANTGTTPDTTASAPAPSPAPVAPPPQPITVPSGTQISIRLTNELNSETAQVGDVFRGAISTPVVLEGVTVIPTTADVEGRVVEVKSAGRYAGQSDLVIELTRLLANGKSYGLITDRWSKAGSSRGKATAAKVGGGAALGAVLGGIFGGGKGAAIGGAVGAGAGTGASSVGKGQQIILKPETVLNFQLQNSIAVVPGSGNHQPLTPAN
jgi:BON domain-containing protein